MKTGLIIIDVQNDYFAGGSMELVGMDEAASNCRKLLDYFRTNRTPVFHIQHIATREGAAFFVVNTPGCEINQNLQPQQDEPVIVKHFPSSFRDTDLNEKLKRAGIEEL
ncbi:MAG: isochorismatase family protein, partial [Planctomycetota bacterium]